MLARRIDRLCVADFICRRLSCLYYTKSTLKADEQFIAQIEPLDVSGPQSLHKPVRVKRGDVGRAARGNDDRHLGERLRAALQHDLLFRPRCHCYATYIA